MIKNIFFDFDGVIAESVSVKTEAFHKMYLPFGQDIADKVVDHHRNNGGVSRFEKFKHYHKKFLGQQITEDKVEELSAKFSDLVVEGVVSAPDVPGSTEFIKRNSLNFKFWIITGTPTNEMVDILKKRGILNYFIEICGSPTNKSFWTDYLIDKYQLNRQEIIFLGDAKSDYNAAMQSNIQFALREYSQNESLFNDYDGLKFSDFNDLEKKLTYI